MKITFLGTGTSQGIPVIGCDCSVCTSEDPRDKRLRSSVLIEINNRNLLIDVGPDFRYQMLNNKIQSLHAILITHEHNDHVAGLDDIRPFNFKQRYNMPIYGMKRVIDDLKERNKYIFNESNYPGLPRIITNNVEAWKCFKILEDIEVLPLPVMHGYLPILGFRIYNFAYITDASYLEDAVIESLHNIDLLVINALHHREHFSHYTLEKAVMVAKSIGAKATYLTHMSHEIGRNQELCDMLPLNVLPAHDGLCINI